KNAIIFLHYGTKTIFQTNLLYTDIETLCKSKHPYTDVYTVFCSPFICKLIKEQNKAFLTLDDIPHLCKNYDSVFCIPSYLSSGSEWQKVKTALQPLNNISIDSPFLEKNVPAIAQIIVEHLHLKHLPHTSCIILSAHGGKASSLYGYTELHTRLKCSYPNTHLILQDQKQPIPLSSKTSECYLLPLRFSSSSHSTQKLISSLFPQLIPTPPLFLWDSLSDLHDIKNLLTTTNAFPLV
ncbi:MAG: sirohydrochlorin cobaltochelatase, partial [Treponemataceae bacterium]